MYTKIPAKSGDRRPPELTLPRCEQAVICRRDRHRAQREPAVRPLRERACARARVERLTSERVSQRSCVFLPPSPVPNAREHYSGLVRPPTTELARAAPSTAAPATMAASCESLAGPENDGAETLGADTLGADTLGADTLGAENCAQAGGQARTVSTAFGCEARTNERARARATRATRAAAHLGQRGRLELDGLALGLGAAGPRANLFRRAHGEARTRCGRVGSH